MRDRLYLDTMHVDRANLIMRYFSIWRSDLKTEHIVVTVRILRSFLWYAMNVLKHVMQSWFLGYMDGHSNHLIKSWVQNRVSTMAFSTSSTSSNSLVNVMNQPLLLLSNMANMIIVKLDNTNYIVWKHQISMVLECLNY